MERENRYIVLKLTDLTQCLDDTDWNRLEDVCNIVTSYRRSVRKAPLQTVVIEEDWPEYEIVWKILEKRVDYEDTISGH